MSTYVLTTMHDWKLWHRLCEPYGRQFQQIIENRKKRSIRLMEEGWNSKNAEEDDCCSLGSFNTGFSCATKDVGINSCLHFKERAKQRMVTPREQKLCLKYGQKTVEGSRIIFRLGTIKIVQSGPAQRDLAITVIREPVFNAKSELREGWIPGEKLSGLVCEINLTRKHGFIETHKGKIFFFVPIKLSSELVTGSVVTFEVVVRESDGRVRAAKIEVLHDTLADDELDDADPVARISNWLESQAGACETTLPEDPDEGDAMNKGCKIFVGFVLDFLFPQPSLTPYEQVLKTQTTASYQNSMKSWNWNLKLNRCTKSSFSAYNHDAL